jgi:predicted PurR-regulated permease PerM
VGGQIFDAFFLMGLTFAALFLPLWLQIAVPARERVVPTGVELQVAEDGTQTWIGLTWEAIEQNPTMQAQWEKLGYSLEGAADIITQPFNYTIDVLGLIVTAAVILGYFAFMLLVSKKEYKQVIAEKFD